MKPILFLVLLFIVLGLLAFGCSNKTTSTNLNSSDQSAFALNAGGARPAPVMYDIWDSQLNSIGQVTITNDALNTYVTFTASGNWMLANTQVHLANGIGQIPRMHRMVPDPASFDYRTDHSPTVQTFMYSISRDDYNFFVTQKMVIAAHCEVVMGDYPNGEYQSDTGWAGDHDGPGSSFWRYIFYDIQSDAVTPPDTLAFMPGVAMLRMNDEPNDLTYRWGRHPWFTFVKVTPDSLPATFYLYSERRYKAGDVMIWKEGDSLFVDVQLLTGVVMSDAKLNISLMPFSGAPAFGKFPWKMQFDPAAGAATFAVHWKPAWGDMLLSLALQADVHEFMP